MTNIEDKKNNNNKISDETIIKTVVDTTLGIQGVSELTGGLTETLGKNLFGINSPNKGVKLAHNDEGLSFDIYVIVEYQVKIPQLAWDIQSKVKEAIENLTAMKVLKVDIHVQGVNLPGEE